MNIKKLIVIIILTSLILPLFIPTVNADTNIFIIDEPADWLTAGFTSTDLPVYTPESLIDFYMPIAFSKLTTLSLNLNDLNHTILYNTTSFDSRLDSIDYKILQSDTHYVVIFHMKVSASTEPFSIDFVPKVKGVSLSQFAWWNSSWEHSKKITISHNNIDTPLDNFPIYVSISADTDVGMSAQSDGDDLRFVGNSNTTILAYELEYYYNDSGDADADIWVNVTHIDNETDTVIYMFYGNPSCDSGEDKTGTWNSGYETVQHMTDKTTSTIEGSTSNAHTGYKNDSGNPAETTGYIYKAQDFPGSAGKGIYIPDDDDFDITDSNTRTYSAIIKSDNWADYPQYMAKWHYYATGAGWQFNTATAAGANPNKPQLYGWVTGASDDWSCVVNSNILYTNSWYYVTAVVDSGDMDIWVNDTEPAATDDGPAQDLSNDRNFCIGTRAGNHEWNGIIDEVRVSTVARNSSWIKAEYHTMFNASFLSFGYELYRPFGGGNGIPGDPYRIAKIEHLDNVRDYLDSWFIIVNDLDFDDNNDYVNASHKTGYTTGGGWDPIDNFEGVINGQNYNISNFFTNHSASDYIGLFGYCISPSYVSNITLIDAYSSGDEYVGSLIGETEGDYVVNCNTINATVNCTDYAGCLIGYATGGTITNCSSSGLVVGGEDIGGLIGDSSSTLSLSHSSATVNGTFATGGLVGYVSGYNVSNCYATGTVNGVTLVGGFTGSNDADIYHCYSTGAVSGTSYVSGFCYNNGDVFNCFYDINTSGITEDYTGNATGLNTYWMQHFSTYDNAGWDITLVDGDPNMYPSFYNTTVWYINSYEEPSWNGTASDLINLINQYDDIRSDVWIVGVIMIFSTLLIYIWYRKKEEV